ncbi:hypothetical protein BG015_010722 [Linnemannia schmuckeri]|uniref:Uncharacterized protein n=1 Tax=Linnemannia schmuckeri TaxID=64567 RepID=A0A9P5RTN3_9FUNG|nr:hypothetical protein BG015_010722 [Linnemannia schmuckeri]
MSKRSFVPNCMTSDGTTFYAHATFSVGSGNTGRSIVIAKSNSNPASFYDVTWSVYATVPEADMGYLGGMNILKSMLCNVDKQGVFTIIATSTKTSINSPETLRMGGYQYTPHADPKTGGTWTTILMKDPYPWSSSGAGGLVSVPAGSAGGPLKTTVFNSYNDLYPIGPPEGPARWAMMTNFSDYAGVVLSGDKIGEFQTTPTRMILTGLSGDGDIWDSSDSGGDGGGSGMSPGVIAGIVGGVILLIMSTTSICRIFSKRSKRHLGFSRPTTPVYEDPDSLVPNITDVPEAKMECEALPMAPATAASQVPLGTTGTGAGEGPVKDSGSSVLPPPLLAPRPFMDGKISQTAQQQQPPSSQAPQTQNTYEDGYQQGFQQALLALRKEQEQQRQTHNPQLLTATLPLPSPQSAASAWPLTSDNTSVTSNSPQYYTQPGNNPQYYPLPVPGSVAYQQQQQQLLQGYYQIGVTTDDPRNPQAYNAGAPLLPVAPGSTTLSSLPAYVSGSASMSPVPSYGTGGSTPYTPPSGPQAWTPGSTDYTSPVVLGSYHHPGNQGPNPSYHQ